MRAANNLKAFAATLRPTRFSNSSHIFFNYLIKVIIHSNIIINKICHIIISFYESIFKIIVKISN